MQRQLIVNGEVLARYGDELVAKINSTTFTPTSVAEFQFGAAPLNVRQSNLDAQRYTVSGGETLRSIARSFYGDDKLWYLIAQANGLSGSTQLSTGQTLSIPKLAASSNAADSFKPYDPSKVVGDLTPNLPMPQNDKGCGALGQIIMIVVAIVVTIYTAGAASELFASNIVSGAIGGAAGSIASQVVGNAIGAVDGFSWKAVAMGAISGGVSGGLNGVNLIGGDVGSFGNVLARAAVGNAMTQGIAVVTGLQKSFDWRGVAASAVGAGVGYGVGSALAEANNGAGAFNSLGDFGGRVARGALAGFAAGTAAAAMRGGRVSATQVATDAFGNALGGSIADAMMPQNSAQESFRLGEINEQNAQARADAIYGLPEYRSGAGLGMRANGGVGLVYAGSRALAETNRSDYLSDQAVKDIYQNMGRRYPEGSGDWGGAEPMALAAGKGFSPGASSPSARPTTTGIAPLDEGIQRGVGSLLLGAKMIHGGAEFLRNQALSLANIATGGALAESSSTVREAVQSNAVLGQALTELPGRASRYALRAVTGNLSFGELGDDIGSMFQLKQISKLNADGDYISAQLLVTEGAVNALGLAAGGTGFVRATYGLTAPVRTGAQLLATEGQAAAEAAQATQLAKIANNFGADSGYVPHTISIFGMPGAVGRGVENFSHPYFYTGHVGYSFDNGGSIYGLGPYAPHLADDIPRLIQTLKDGVGYPGFVTNDRLFFKEALNSQATARYGIGKEFGTARQTVYKLDMPVTRGEFETAQRLTLERGFETPLPEFPYSFKTGGACVAPYNCATYPSSLGLPIPANTGAVSRYVPAMIQQGATPWRPLR